MRRRRRGTVAFHATFTGQLSTALPFSLFSYPAETGLTRRRSFKLFRISKAAGWLFSSPPSLLLPLSLDTPSLHFYRASLTNCFCSSLCCIALLTQFSCHSRRVRPSVRPLVRRPQLSTAIQAPPRSYRERPRSRQLLTSSWSHARPHEAPYQQMNWVFPVVCSQIICVSTCSPEVPTVPARARSHTRACLMTDKPYATHRFRCPSE